MAKHRIYTTSFASVYPKPEAAKVAVTTVAAFLEENALPETVVFCCFDEHAAELHGREIERLGES